MKKFMALAFALFFAVANAAETYEASEKITQEILAGEGKFTQTVNAGDEIASIKIWYHGMDENKHQSGNISEIGLTEKWTGSVCEISGKIDRDLITQTVKAYILVQDDEGKFAKTEFEFTVLEKEETLSLKWNESSGDVNQEVTAGKSITPIVFDYEGITSYSVSGLPSGLVKNIDEKKHKIMIVGSVNSDVMSGDYEYKVTVKNDQGDEKSMSGTIVVKSGKARTSIKLVSEKARQEVLAGNEIEPVVFEFANVRDDESLSSFKFEGSLKGLFAYSVEGNKLTCSGTVDENLKGGLYTIRIIAIGENNNDTAFANVDVIHKSVVTSVSVVENETQTVTAGDSIEPIVFKFENVVKIESVTGFPGGFKAEVDNATKSVIVFGLVSEDSKGPYTVKLSVNGSDNDASAEATINVTPVKLKFELVEGSDDQTVVAGEAITPIVYAYDHVKFINGKGFPADLKVEQDKENKLIKISGTVNSKAAAKEYVYTFELTDVYSEKTTVSGKINVVAASSSSSVVTSSSSVASSSSHATESSSSVVKSSSSSSEKAESSSSEKTIKIVTVAMNGVKFGYANNALTVSLPASSMVRVQVFDLTGHLVETFAEPVNGTKSISLAHLNRGNYLVRVESNSMVRTARIAVK
ncbi:hypothetical protein Fisuc_2144 [Fibrobacter succinogenes subsp. succinogenes S85]|nr:T9SS type A sorting domain-containing protein [Fibrobacter succinogenes]ACX75731.1 hypothetical protein Fisuc_2144 [Fibrobacter succinogenes subsp. succinogenes S85]